MTPLSAKRRSELRAEAHKLSPVVIIGDKGLTDEVIVEIDRSLKAHELIKVRAATDERDARAVWIETICDRLQAHAVQQIGKIFVIYRENPKEKKVTRDTRREGQVVQDGKALEKKPGTKKRLSRVSGLVPPLPSTRTSRPRSRTPSPRPASAPRQRRRSTSR
jgi:putative YhbY family RNA-binding protein